ncbi:MAG: 4'-phosphopantetheinyl transferase superfamily protein [Chloroflexi bacterium]|nr:MAG: 4'-phosphopantetheinyl transferase superfamily protein [Chloroflexota bacterium]
MDIEITKINNQENEQLQLQWQTPPHSLVLPTEDLHLWVAVLDRTEDELEAFWATLSEEEQERASRFYFERDRNRYVVARGLLRVILGRYLRLPPAHISFAYGEFGKPMLANMTESGIQFNVSHAQEIGVFAFTRNKQVGVDVEAIRPLSDIDQIAERFFSPYETAVFREIPPDYKPEAFFNCWTRKEAYIKAIGEGLSCPLEQFDVTLRPGEPARLLRVRTSRDQAKNWFMHAFTPEPGYVAAVVAEQPVARLQGWRWP